jgi:uncharacterized protein YoxC
LLMIEILTVAIALGLMALIRQQGQQIERAQWRIDELESAVSRLETEGDGVDTSTL